MPQNLNDSCHCISLDEEMLRSHFETALLGAGSLPDLLLGREHLFAPYPVFASRTQLDSMQAVIGATQEVFALPGFQTQALAGKTWPDQHTRGVLTGFDFHPEPDGVKLIEINTNVGGAYLAALLNESQRACCQPVADVLASPMPSATLPARWLQDFVDEWRLAGRAHKPREVLIVDENPEGQFLYPEFLLFRELFRRNGIGCQIADPRELSFAGGRLRHAGRDIDLVYNRLTDFTLAQPGNTALNEAWLADAVVLTPSPRHHALYADKRHLVRLSDDAWLREIGASASARSVLAAHVPRARLVRIEDAEELWAARKRYFFKPFAGYASRGAYRGESMTRRVWQQILDSGNYIAQEFAAPPQRRSSPGQDAQTLKFDLRCVTHGAELRLLSARLYQGQTTNLRTQSGGLGSVYMPAINVPA